MTLVHSDLPDTEAGRGHERGLEVLLDILGILKWLRKE